MFLLRRTLAVEAPSSGVLKRQAQAASCPSVALACSIVLASLTAACELAGVIDETDRRLIERVGSHMRGFVRDLARSLAQ